MSAEWFSARELAGLPGMPTTAKGVKGRATAECWKSRERQGQGGGREFHVSDLPKLARDYLLHQAIEQARASHPAPLSAPGTALAPIADPAERRLTSSADRQAVGALADWQRDQMQARAYVLSLIDELTLALGTQGRAVTRFIDNLQGGTLAPEVLAAVQRANARAGEGQRTLTRPTLYRWLKERTKGLAALAPKAPPLAAQPLWLGHLLALYQVPQKPSIAECVRTYWPATYPGIPAPELRTAQRHLERLPMEVREWGRMGRNARRAIEPFVRRTTTNLWPMDIVTVDGHLFKAYVRHPLTGRRFRPEVTTYLDLATRKVVGFSAWIAESSFAIWTALRAMVLNPACGVPAIHYSDNGAYRSEAHRTLLARIGTTPSFAEVYRAQSRGVIERFNRSVWVPLARTQATYCGDDCDAEALKLALKQADDDESRLLAWDDFCQTALAALGAYNAKPHRTLSDKCPDQAWSEAVQEGWQPTLLEDDDLHDLLPSYLRTVARGEVKVPWGRYFDERLRAWHGQEVEVAVVPTDGARVWVSSLERRLICIAERDKNARGYFHETQVDHARAQREQGRVDRLERKLAAVHEEGRGLIEVQAAAPVDVLLHAQTVAAMDAPAPLNALDAINDERRRFAFCAITKQRIEAGETVGPRLRETSAIYFASSEARSIGESYALFGLVPEDFINPSEVPYEI